MSDSDSPPLPPLLSCSFSSSSSSAIPAEVAEAGGEKPLKAEKFPIGNERNGSESAEMGGMYFSQPDPMRGNSYLTSRGPPPGVTIPVQDPNAVKASVVKQIDYYFSIENLCRDIYLRTNMDEQGFVPVSIIASFCRVRSLTTNLSLISDAMRSSTVVELQDNKLRKRNDWEKWLFSPMGSMPSSSS